MTKLDQASPGRALRLIILAGAMAIVARAARADESELRITGVNPSNGQVEVTHFGTAPFVTSAALPFCARQIYTSNIPAGIIFDAGQTILFTLTGLNSASSDLWLYRDANFGSSASIISGLIYGGNAFPHRAAVAAAAGIWPSGAPFVAAPPVTQSLQLTAFDPTDPANWAPGGSLGTYFGDGADIANPLPNTPQGSLVIELEPIVTGQSQPLGMLFPDPNNLDRPLFWIKRGRVRFLEGGVPSGTDFLNVASRLLGANEEGLLGMALHPNFPADNRVFTYTSEAPTATADFFAFGGGNGTRHSVIAEWRLDAANPDVIDMGTRREILRITQPAGNHNGGAIHFGPDGFFYIALGDGGGGNDSGGGHAPEGNGQRLDVIHGSILRIDVDGTNSANGRYGIPASNPFVGVPGIDEIFVYGLRNPFTFTFDTSNGDIYIADVGQRDIEEIDLLPFGQSGLNYGWRIKEGSFFFSGGSVVTIPDVPVPPGLVDPIAQYDHGEGNSSIGGFKYRGAAIGAMAGLYLFGDLSGGLFYIDGAGELRRPQIGVDDRGFSGSIVGFDADPEGEIYVMTGSSILKVVPIPPPTSARRWSRYKRGGGEE